MPHRARDRLAGDRGHGTWGGLLRKGPAKWVGKVEGERRRQWVERKWRGREWRKVSGEGREGDGLD